MIRLRQAVVAARDRDAVVAELCTTFGLSVCFHDPGVADFGLHNALMVIGDQFLEVVSPIRPNTAAGRLIERRGGDCGYMVMFEVDDLDVRMAAAAAEGVRTVWQGDHAGHDVAIRGRHLHPKDIGGAIVSLDEATPQGSWLWGGPTWVAHQDTSVVTAIAGVELAVSDADAAATRWAAIGLTSGVRFVAGDRNRAGLVTIELVAADRQRVGTSHTIAGTEFRLV